jgi:rod shape-determining protein MreD
MNVVVLFIFGLLLIVLQTTLFGAFGLSFLKPPLALGAVIYAAFYMEAVRGLILAFIVGYAIDVYSGGVQGITPIVMVLLFLTGRLMSRVVVVEGKAALAVVALAFCMLYGLLWMELEALVRGGTIPSDIPIVRIAMQALFLAVLSPILVSVAAFLDRLTTAGWNLLERKRG